MAKKKKFDNISLWNRNVLSNRPRNKQKEVAREEKAYKGLDCHY